MNDEPKDNAELEQLRVDRKVWFGILVVFYLLVSFLLLGLVVNFDEMHWPPVRGFVVLVLIGSLFSVGFYFRQLISSSPEKSKYKKFAKGVSIFSFVSALILILGLPQFSSYKARNYPADTRSNLHNIYLACKAYWADNGEDKNCNVENFSRTTYGYIQSRDVSVSGSGTETTFAAKGYNTKGTKTFFINYFGEISEMEGK